jgi:uncharacterized damage-inducible protein DinB
MTVTIFYDYLTRARRDLFAFLRSMPDEAIARDLIPGKRFHCIKDLVLHVAVVEDSWVHEDILKDAPVWESAVGFPEKFEQPYQNAESLEWMLEYWLNVEKSTLEHLERFERSTSLQVLFDSKDGKKAATVDDILWHVMQHEVRHTAQIAVLARQLGFSPPPLDLIAYTGSII